MGCPGRYGARWAATAIGTIPGPPPPRGMLKVLCRFSWHRSQSVAAVDPVHDAACEPSSPARFWLERAAAGPCDRAERRLELAECLVFPLRLSQRRARMSAVEFGSRDRQRLRCGI